MPSLIQAFAATRMAVGVLAWLAPSLAARIFGLDPVTSRQPILSQLFGARECALAAATATSSGETRRRVLALGVMIDSADTVASLLQMRRGAFSTRAKILTAGGAAFFAAVGAAALAGELRDGTSAAGVPEPLDAR
jgi:hypothetical protein